MKTFNDILQNDKKSIIEAKDATEFAKKIFGKDFKEVRETEVSAVFYIKGIFFKRHIVALSRAGFDFKFLNISLQVKGTLEIVCEKK